MQRRRAQWSSSALARERTAAKPAAAATAVPLQLLLQTCGSWAALPFAPGPGSCKRLILLERLLKKHLVFEWADTMICERLYPRASPVALGVRPCGPRRLAPTGASNAVRAVKDTEIRWRGAGVAARHEIQVALAGARLLRLSAPMHDMFSATWTRQSTRTLVQKFSNVTCLKT